MQFAQQGIISSGGIVAPKELFLIIGDSNADGRGSSIPTVPRDTLYDWNGSSFDEITTQTVANDGAYGSAWQQLAIDYKANTGKAVAIVQHAIGGSEFFPNGDTTNWYTSGDLYTPAKDAALAAKSAIGASVVKVIICLGINDIRGAQVVANIETAILSLQSRLTTDIPGCEIYWILPGRDETIGYSSSSGKHQHIRRIIVNVALDANNHVATQTLPYATWGLMQGDNLHFTQTGYNLMGSQIARYMASSSSYNRHTRSIIGSLKNDISTAKKDAINTFVTFFGSGFTGTVDSFYCLVGSDYDNKLVDWGFISAPSITGTLTDATAGVTTPGNASNYIRTNIYQDTALNVTRTTNTDYAEFVKTGTVTTAAGTSAFLFGKTNASRSSRTYQAADGLHVQSCDGTDNVYATETKFANNAVYSVARNGTSKILKKDSTDVVSVVQATTGTMSDRDSFIGTINNAGSAHASGINAQFKAYGLIQLSDVTWANFVTELNTLLTAMES
jgi:lysophospholipase L1-like esterase